MGHEMKVKYNVVVLKRCQELEGGEGSEERYN